MKLLLLVLALVAATASAFLAASNFNGMALAPRTAAPSSSQLQMSNRFNAKKQKAKRNQDNMRKFRKRGTSKKKIVRGKRQTAARERESDFMAKLYQHAEGKEESA